MEAEIVIVATTEAGEQLILTPGRIRQPLRLAERPVEATLTLAE